MTRESLLAVLPPFDNVRVLIKKKQSVSDIMQETLDAHEFFEKDYDTIGTRFLGGSDVDVLKRIFNFLKQYVQYKEESVRLQQTKSPAAIIETGICDCKCFALFIGGVLSAINREGGDFDWNYAYASYSPGIRTPGHIFVQVRVNGKEYWVDPVLSDFDKRFPVPSFIRRKQKVDDMALYRISGTRIGYTVEGDAAVNVYQTSLPATTSPVTEPYKFSIGNWVQANPLLVAGGVVALYFLLRKKRTKRR